jgi:hypothetical protein
MKALTVGATAHTAFDVACAAYRASWPGLDDADLRRVVAHSLALIAKDRGGATEAL